MKVLIASSLIALGIAACSGAQSIPSNAQRVVVSLDRIDCSDCGEQIVGDLRQRPGIYEAVFDKHRAEISVVASPSFDVFTTVRQLAAQQGFEAILGAGKGHYLHGPSFPEGADAKTVVEGGADVPDLGVVLVPGKVTVVDFSATWCGPCRQIDEHMARVLTVRRDVAYRRLEIGDWDTPLARRYLRNVPQLPYVIVYGSDGVKLKEFAGVDLAGLDAAIEKGAPRP